MSEIRISSVRFEKGCMVIECDWPGDYFSMNLGGPVGRVVFGRLPCGMFRSVGALPAGFDLGPLVSVADCGFLSLDSTSSNEAHLEKSMDEIRDAIAMVREDIRDMNVPRHSSAALKNPWYGRF